MSLPLILLPAARAEFDDAADWYGQKSVALGERFIDAARDALKRIRDAPERYGFVLKGVRCALVRRFPYAIYYQIQPESIVVVAVVHAKRDPGVWQLRVRP